jgi:hypothetical protein
MAKQVRAARHYQDRRSAVRLIADAGIPSIKRDVKGALQHMRTLLPADADQRARAGDWHGLIRNIAWGHFREVLKAPFARIGKVREAGAQLGAQKINGTFAQARRQVKFRKIEYDPTERDDAQFDDLAKYSPDQPRDERGRWTSSHSIDLGGRKITVTRDRASRASGHRIVEVNVAALNHAWSQDKGFYVGEHGTGAAIGNRYDNFRQWIATHDSMEASVVGVQSDGRVGFENGRHRFAVLRDAGLRTIPVAMDRASARNAQRFGLLAKRYSDEELGKEVIGNSVSSRWPVSGRSDNWRTSAGDITEAVVEKDIGDRFTFDLYDEKTQARLRQAQDDLIQQIEDTSRDTIEQIIISGAQDGLGPDEIVGDIRDMIGLTDRQAQAVLNYESMLRDLDPDALVRRLRNGLYDDQLQEAIDNDDDLSEAAIVAMTGDYLDNFLDYRAEMIAQTEATRAASAGLQDAYAQAIDRGVFPSDAVRQFWQIAGDEKTCEICQSCADMNEDGVAIDEPFDSIDGPQDAPPDPHPSCRCSLEIVTDLDQVPEE